MASRSSKREATRGGLKSILRNTQALYTSHEDDELQDEEMEQSSEVPSRGEEEAAPASTAEVADTPETELPAEDTPPEEAAEKPPVEDAPQVETLSSTETQRAEVPSGNPSDPSPKRPTRLTREEANAQKDALYSRPMVTPWLPEALRPIYSNANFSYTEKIHGDISDVTNRLIDDFIRVNMTHGGRRLDKKEIVQLALEVFLKLADPREGWVDITELANRVVGENSK